MESHTEKDRLADEFTTLQVQPWLPVMSKPGGNPSTERSERSKCVIQDQNGKLEMELFDLKSSLDAQVAAAKDRDSGWALKVPISWLPRCSPRVAAPNAVAEPSGPQRGRAPSLLTRNLSCLML